ncbi:hypothetical protein ESZ50_07985 [Weissella muntiaci]|uniref:Uncharacterized protein n=1 Tax=Weissella muntiaci TaxID=2508881 RepID=A0A6C2C4H4_9LACO|nr:hypothetical protein [Weissella muntiaci]TYC48808.1 hypothetical protein ESZ50_07985 [Weissella muntiaci]
MLSGVITEDQYDVSTKAYKKNNDNLGAFDKATNVQKKDGRVEVYFENYKVFKEWFDDFTDATVAYGFNSEGEPTKIGLIMESVHDDLFDQIQK